MSDILIKNIGTLKEPTPITLYPNGYWEDYTTGESGEFVGLPTPHGRLIDADRLVRELKNIMSEDNPRFVELMYIIGQSTIIEAEADGT